VFIINFAHEKFELENIDGDAPTKTPDAGIEQLIEAGRGETEKMRAINPEASGSLESI
jgi:hypothetical protein